jgi:hypothetical protein
LLDWQIGKMGGDDLGSDDEGWTAAVVASDEESDESRALIEPETRKKRKLVVGDADISSRDDAPKTANNAKRQSREKLLIEAGRNIEQQSVEEQAVFLTTAVGHHSLVATASAAPTTVGASLSFLPKHFCSSSKGSFLERVKEVMSMKKAKKWNTRQSPYAVIVCISARRAVAVLKELSSLKIRAAKLFPKNASISEQMTQLRDTPFGLAVGTPHRLAVLTSSAEGESEAAMNFEHTQLIIIDSMLSQKQYSVVSIPSLVFSCS